MVSWWLFRLLCRVCMVGLLVLVLVWCVMWLVLMLIGNVVVWKCCFFGVFSLLLFIMCLLLNRCIYDWKWLVLCWVWKLIRLYVYRLENRCRWFGMVCSRLAEGIGMCRKNLMWYLMLCLCSSEVSGIRW